MTVPGLGKRKPRIRRDWAQATEKVAAEESRCRVCGSRFGIERAHVIGRVHDDERPIRDENWKPYVVAPDRVIPLCRDCHQGPQGQHAGRLDLLPHLTLDEQVQAVADAGGISRAYELLMPSQNPKRVTSGAGWPE